MALGVIDQGSRAVLRLCVLGRKCTWTLLGHLCLAIAQHGRPRAIRCDNEGMFGSPVWLLALRLARIRRERIAPRCPWLNGQIERLFGTLKSALRAVPLKSPEGLQASLDEFTDFYNHARSHQALGGLTPALAWHGVARVDLRHATGGEWVSAFDGSLTGYRIRC